MVANERGVRDNLDPDYLHDFRVAARRTRSLLSQMKKVFPPGEAERYRREFSWLGNRSGPTRDLDVMLLKMPSCVEALSPAVQSDVSVLLDVLRRWQREQHGLFVRALDSERYSLLVRQWGSFLEEPPPRVWSGDERANSGMAAAARPIIHVASRRIRKAHRKVLKKGRSIHAQTTPQALHQMRIRCKKLRYLLEFFGSLYATEGIRKVVNELKQLQDNLGDFNDYVVQQRLVRQAAHDLAEGGSTSVEVLLTAGSLMDRLAAGEELERTQFGEYFRFFSRAENQRLFDQLFRESNG